MRVGIRIRGRERTLPTFARMREDRFRWRQEYAVGLNLGGTGAQRRARGEAELIEVTRVFEHAVIEIDVEIFCVDQHRQMKADIARVDARFQAPFKRELDRLRHLYPVGAGGEHAADFSAHAKAECADSTGVGGVTVVVKIKHAGQQQAGFHRKNVAVAAAPDIVKILYAPLFGGLPVERATFGGACAAVNHVMVADHHHFVRRSKTVDAERIELAFRTHHHAVVNHDEVRVGEHHVAGTHRRLATLGGEHLFDGGHAHDTVPSVMPIISSAARPSRP